MSNGTCRDCGAAVIFRRNWLGRWSLIDPNPPEWRRMTYLEVSKDEFVEVYRHVCEAEPKTKKEAKR